MKWNLYKKLHEYVSKLILNTEFDGDAPELANCLFPIIIIIIIESSAIESLFHTLILYKGNGSYFR